MKYVLEKAEKDFQLAGFTIVWRDAATSSDLESLKGMMKPMDRIVEAKSGDIVFYGTQRDEREMNS